MISGSWAPDLIPAVEEDRAFFVSCHHAAYRATVEKMFDWNPAEQDELVSDKFDQPGTHLIKVDGVKIGVVGIHNKSNHMWLRDFFILPAHQNTGIGRSVLGLVQRRTDDVGLELRLRTLRFNHRARDFYQRHGFNLVAQDDLHFHMTYRGG